MLLREALTEADKKGRSMTPDAVAIAVMVILLVPMGYFMLASPAFLFVKLDIQPVAQLLRAGCSTPIFW
jgi:hypothetical protein